MAPQGNSLRGESKPMQVVLVLFRYVVPGGLVAFGFMYWALGFSQGQEAFSLFVGAGLSVALLNYLFRVGVSGEAEREEEDRAREFFSRHGYWPDDAPLK